MELTHSKEIRIIGNPIGQTNKTKHICVKLILAVICQKRYTKLKND